MDHPQRQAQEIPQPPRREDRPQPRLRFPLKAEQPARAAESAVSGLPETVVSTINAINTGTGLAEAGTGLDLSGYNALVGTTAVMTYQAGTRVEKTGATNMPVYVPNLVEGLGTVQVLFYNNMTSKWELITPTSVDVAKKMIHVTIPNSGTFSVIYKR